MSRAPRAGTTYGGTGGTQLFFNGTRCNVVVAGALTNPCIAPLSPLVEVTGGERQDKAEIGVPQQASVDRTQGAVKQLIAGLN